MSPRAGSGGEDRITENITLNFSAVQVDYTPQKKDGTAGATATATWNIAKELQRAGLIGRLGEMTGPGNRRPLSTALALSGGRMCEPRRLLRGSIHLVAIGCKDCTTVYTCEGGRFR
jgi:hypothetical protein